MKENMEEPKQLVDHDPDHTLIPASLGALDPSPRFGVPATAKGSGSFSALPEADLGPELSPEPNNITKVVDVGPPPDGGKEAWLVVLGGFLLMYTSFGLSEFASAFPT
jgi:hypothetical protein